MFNKTLNYDYVPSDIIKIIKLKVLLFFVKERNIFIVTFHFYSNVT